MTDFVIRTKIAGCPRCLAFGDLGEYEIIKNAGTGGIQREKGGTASAMDCVLCMVVAGLAAVWASAGRRGGPGERPLRCGQTVDALPL